MDAKAKTAGEYTVVCMNKQCDYYAKDRKAIVLPVGDGLFAAAPILCQCNWAVYKTTEL